MAERWTTRDDFRGGSRRAAPAAPPSYAAAA